MEKQKPQVKPALSFSAKDEKEPRYGELTMNRSSGAIRFDEDSFELRPRKKGLTFAEQRARDKRVRRQILFGRIALVVVAVVIFFLLFLLAVELGIMNFR